MIKLETIKFKKILSKAIVACTFDKTQPLTSLFHFFCAIFVEEVGTKTKSVVGATDGNNVLEMQIEEIVDGEWLSNSSVDAKKMYQLISKTKSKYVTLEQSEDRKTLIVVGDGTYKLPIMYDDSGKLVRISKFFHTNNKPITYTKGLEIKLDDFKKALSVNKNALPKTQEDSSILGYYLKTGKDYPYTIDIITTNQYVICETHIESHIWYEDLYLSSRFVTILNAMDGDMVNFAKVSPSDLIILDGNNFSIVGFQDKGKGDYPIIPIMELINTEKKYTLQVKRVKLLEALDRLSIFVGDYESNAIKLSFKDKEKISLTPLSGSGKEEIIVKSHSIHHDYEIKIDVDVLKKQIGALKDDYISIVYGFDDFIIIIGMSTYYRQVISTLGDK